MDKGSFFFLIVILLLVGVFCFLGWTAYHNAQVKKVQAVSVVLPILLFKSYDASGCDFDKDYSLCGRTELNYMVTDGVSMVGEGVTRKEGYVEQSVDNNYSFFVWSFDKDFRNFYTSKSISPVNSFSVGSRSVYPLKNYRVGGLSLFANDTLHDGGGSVRVSVNHTGRFENMGVCFSWSSNVLYASVSDYIDVCGGGWLNYSMDYGNGTFDFYSSNVFRCAGGVKDRVHLCKSLVGGDRCVIGDYPIPLRLVNEFNHCYDIDFSVAGDVGTPVFDIEYRDYNLTGEDYVKVLFMDKQQYFYDGVWSIGFEMPDGSGGTKDIGGGDYVITLRKE